MLSEWMIEKPEDFEANWLMVPCPVGKRSLIIASKVIYNKSALILEPQKIQKAIATHLYIILSL